MPACEWAPGAEGGATFYTAASKKRDFSFTHKHTRLNILVTAEKAGPSEPTPPFSVPLRNPCLDQPVFCRSLVNLKSKCLLNRLQANLHLLSGREEACSTQPVEVRKTHGFIKSECVRDDKRMCYYLCSLCGEILRDHLKDSVFYTFTMYSWAMLLYSNTEVKLKGKKSHLEH